MVTKIEFKDKKQNRVTWINGGPVRFKNGVATVEDDKIAKELLKKEDYDIFKEDKKDNDSDSKEDKKDNDSDSKEDKKDNTRGKNGKK